MTIKFLDIIWFTFQFIIGYHLIFPLILLIISKIKKANNPNKSLDIIDLDYAIIVTAFEETDQLPMVVSSILKQNHQKYIVYIIADKFDISTLTFNDERIVLLKPEKVIGSNTGSHQYAIDHFKRDHNIITIIDSDNILHQNYLTEITHSFKNGYVAVQGVRAAKNLNSTYACLDAARDIYYHFYDGKILFKCGSSATLAGSGMAFSNSLYTSFLKQNKVSGAGFDKVLQAYILKQDITIAFNEKAIVYDEKTTHSDQLVKQRSRWINTWFKYFKFGFDIIFEGIKNLSINQFLFGLVLLRPPLFIFLLLSMLITIINIALGINYLIWIIGFICFISSFFIALIYSETDKKIYTSLINIPKFMFFQVLSLMKVKQANKISVATKHYSNSNKTEHQDK
jgi:cellulose synthase/poly-beta-1,6-N-acetylglucosamine synthase-like glycosyltransferase